MHTPYLHKSFTFFSFSNLKKKAFVCYYLHEGKGCAEMYISPKFHTALSSGYQMENNSYF